MKKLLLFTFLTLCFIACSDDDTPLVSISADDILGTWSLTNLSSTTTQTYDFQGIKHESKTVVSGKNYDFIITFNSNPNTYTTEGAITLQTSTTTDGDTVTNEYETSAAAGLDSGDWSVSSNTLTMGSDIQNSEMTLESYTDTKFVLKQVINEKQNINGAIITINGTSTIVFER